MGPKSKVELIDSYEYKATPSDNDGSDNDGGSDKNDNGDEVPEEEKVKEAPAKKSKTTHSP